MPSSRTTSSSEYCHVFVGTDAPTISSPAVIGDILGSGKDFPTAADLVKVVVEDSASDADTTHFVPATAVPEYTTTDTEVTQGYFGAQTGFSEPGTSTFDAATVSFVANDTFAKHVAIRDAAKNANVVVVVVDGTAANYSVEIGVGKVQSVTNTRSLDGYRIRNLNFTVERVANLDS